VRPPPGHLTSVSGRAWMPRWSIFAKVYSPRASALAFASATWLRPPAPTSYMLSLLSGLPSYRAYSALRPRVASMACAMAVVTTCEP